MNAAETLEKDFENMPMDELFARLREEAGWPQPWIDIMYPGYLDRARAHAILAKQPETPIYWG